MKMWILLSPSRYRKDEKIQLIWFKFEPIFQHFQN